MQKHIEQIKHAVRILTENEYRCMPAKDRRDAHELWIANRAIANFRYACPPTTAHDATKGTAGYAHNSNSAEPR